MGTTLVPHIVPAVQGKRLFTDSCRTDQTLPPRFLPFDRPTQREFPTGYPPTVDSLV